MAKKKYKSEPNTDYNIENITVYNKYYGADQYAYRVEANDGYVMYDATAESTYFDDETEKEIPCVYYFRNVDIPIRCANTINDFIAVEESTVNKDFIL